MGGFSFRNPSYRVFRKFQGKAAATREHLKNA